MSNASIVRRMRDVVDALKSRKISNAEAEGSLESHAAALEGMSEGLRRELTSLTFELVQSDWEEDMQFPVPQTPEVVVRIEDWLDRVPA